MMMNHHISTVMVFLEGLYHNAAMNADNSHLEKISNRHGECVFHIKMRLICSAVVSV